MGVRIPCIAGGLALLSLFNIKKPNEFVSDLKLNSTSTITIQVPSELQSIVDGSLSLVGLQYSSREPENLDITNVSFCALDWRVQKAKPQSFPRYGNLIKASNATCGATRVTYSLQHVLAYTRAYDDLFPETKLKQEGFIFHESRSGSTLAANMLTAANPKAHRVYSEPMVVQKALMSRSSHLVKQVLYLLSRSSDRQEKKVFFKLRSTCTRKIKYMPTDMRWMFFYRNPIDILQSHFNPGEEKVGGVVCLQSRAAPSDSELRIAHDAGYALHKNLTNPKICAVRFVSLSHAAIAHHNNTGGQGRFVNYNTVPDSLLETHFPEYFGISLSKAALKRLHAIAGVYSKGNPNAEVQQYEKKKQKKPSKGLQNAAKEFMEYDYAWMDRIAASSAEAVA